VLDSQPLLAGGKIWLVVRVSGQPDYALAAYDPKNTVAPVLKTDLNSVFAETDTQSSQVRVAADDHVLWLSLAGRLLYFDLTTGEQLGSLGIGGHVADMGFDGKNLWILSNDDGLIEVFIPWEQ
jgi:hypothetical protein